jgi:hypothetical protein
LRTSLVAVGIVLIVVGLGLWAFAVYTPAPTQTSTTTTTEAAIPSSNRAIDANGVWAFGMNLQGGEQISGNAVIQNFNTTAGPAFFYIQNESLFIDWGGCAPCAEPSQAMGHLAPGSFQNFTIPSSGSLSYSWTAPTTGAYYAVFDDSAYGAPAQATLTANGVAPITVTTSAPYLNGYLPLTGAAIAVIGIIIAAIGAVMAGGSKSAPISAPPAKATEP